MFFNQFPYTDFHELNADWIVRHFKEFIDSFKRIDGWIDEHQKEYDELKEIYDTLYNGTLTPALEESLSKWVNTNLETLIGDAIKNVYFGLTNDGYFCAFIPQSWNWVTFSTIEDPDEPLYGHLVLMYD